MRHRKDTFKIGRNSGHRRCLMANMLKSFIRCGRVSTTQTKAKALQRSVEKLITIAKKGTLAAKRLVISKVMLKNSKPCNKRKPCVDNKNVLSMLFADLAVRFCNRSGGYTRIIKTERRVGDAAQMCLLEFLES